MQGNYSTEETNSKGRLSFGLSSDQCELLVSLEAAGSMSQLAQLMGKDISVISRQLQKLAQTSPVLEKHQGRWRLSRLGKDISNWTRDAAAVQKRVLNQQTSLRIATTREFGSRFLAPHIDTFLGEEKNTIVSILTLEAGVEQALLAGEADIGFDCGRPEDPLLAFKMVIPETFITVVSPNFLKTHGIESVKKLQPTQDPTRRAFSPKLVQLPHLQYTRASASRLLHLTYELSNIRATFNDIASTRSACCAGLGWAVLPTYTVKKELDAGLLLGVPGWDLASEKFGVWWIRGRTPIVPWAKHAIHWLKTLSLQ